jgi:hypothetical protein
MAKVGRNDPCPCGSGKKYKQCHLPLEEAARTEQLRQRRAVDTLMPKLFAVTQSMPEDINAAFGRYWDSKYTAEQMATIDDLEDRGADRFLSWFAFDYALDDGRTVVERAAAAIPPLDLTEEEAGLLPYWASVRLRPYVVDSIDRNHTVMLSDMLSDATYTLADQAASRRLLQGEVLVAHLVPAGGLYYIGGAAAHLTEDTREKLREYVELHTEAFARDNPGASGDDFIRQRSEVLNHFVMQLPVEQVDPTLLDQILLQTRVSLQMAGESLGLVNSSEAPDGEQR